MDDSIAALTCFRKAVDKAYGLSAGPPLEMHVGEKGSLAEIVAFARG